MAGLVFFLAGCLETTQEVTINTDGAGQYSTTNDMSAILAMAKSMGGDDTEKMNEMKVDTVINLDILVDSIPSLTADEKTLMKNGQIKMKIDFAEEKGVYSIHFPFSSLSEINKLNKLSNKLLGETMKKQMSGDSPVGDMPAASSMDDYFEVSYKNGQIKKKLDKDKYAGVGSDEYLNGMKEASQMGMPMSNTLVYNLPRPAKKVEGKNVTLSDDRMKVTVKSSLDEFFDQAENLEFEIEY